LIPDGNLKGVVETEERYEEVEGKDKEVGLEFEFETEVEEDKGVGYD